MEVKPFKKQQVTHQKGHTSSAYFYTSAPFTSCVSAALLHTGPLQDRLVTTGVLEMVLHSNPKSKNFPGKLPQTIKKN